MDSASHRTQKQIESENLGAYPYITNFKKIPFESFLQTKRKSIGPFYISEYNKVVKFYQYFNDNLFSDKSLNLENLYWFLLLRKYLKEDKYDKKEQIYEFVKKCEVVKRDKRGFKFSPYSKQKEPDLWSTYFALAVLKMSGLLNEYFATKGPDQIKKELKDFIQKHEQGEFFSHCLERDCPICQKTTPERTLYFVLEMLQIFGTDPRLIKDQFKGSFSDKRKDNSLVFRLLCYKLLDLESEVKEKDIAYLLDFQKENGGFSFKNINGSTNTTFWVVCALEQYSWLLDYNPIGIFSFLNLSLYDILNKSLTVNMLQLMELSKLVILLSIIWKKFIEEVERMLFKQLEQFNFVNLDQIKKSFGLSHGIEEVISYINRNYSFKLRILDNKIEFNNYTRGLDPAKKAVAIDLYSKIKQNSVVPLAEYSKKSKGQHFSPLKEDEVSNLLAEMMNRNFFKGRIAKKGKLSPKRFFYLDAFLEKAIVSDTEIKLDQILQEKASLKDHRNTIYNMIVKLKNASSETKEEVDSYLLINEIDIAKERIKYLIHNTLMDAEFLNENIEQSFKEQLYYINLQEVLSSEINQWKKEYTILKTKLRDLETNLQAKIEEKENLRNFNKLLEELDSKIFDIHENINKDLDSFKSFFREKLEKNYTEENFNEVIQELNKVSQKVSKYDNNIYKVSQQITTKEEKLTVKHKKIIQNWVSIKSEYDDIFGYYVNGFNFFKTTSSSIINIKEKTLGKIEEISEKSNEKLKKNQFQEAFDLIKKESDLLLNEKVKEIKTFQEEVKRELKSRQKLYILYRYLYEDLDALEENIIKLIAEQGQALKNTVFEERSRATIEDFDNFVSSNLVNYKSELNKYKNTLENAQGLRIKDVIGDYEKLNNQFAQIEKDYAKQLLNSKNLIYNFEEKSRVTMIQFETFRESFIKELETVRENYTNKIIAQKINEMANEKNTNNIKVKEVANELDIKCKVIMNTVKQLIETSKFDGQLYEEKKCIVVYNEDFYKNRDLKNFMNNTLLKQIGETYGKILALYDSSIKNRTLSVNTLELQNRIADLEKFQDQIKVQFNTKVTELNIHQNRNDFKEIKKNIDTTIENNNSAIVKIDYNLKIFNKLLGSISQEFESLRAELLKQFAKIFDISGKDKPDAYAKIEENLISKQKELDEKIVVIQDKIEAELKKSLASQNYDLNKLNPEIGEFLVKKKNSFRQEYDEKKSKATDDIFLLKDDSLRTKLIAYINNQKIHLSQLLGTIQAKVEDDIEIKEFKRANQNIQRRSKALDLTLKEIYKSVKDNFKEYNKESKNFETKNKYILDEFTKFINEFNDILNEKVKSLEQFVLVSYINVAIKAVANEFLSVSFLQNELGLKKKNIQDHLIYLISGGKLPGKYDPRLSIYYENPDIVKNLNEDELQVVKKMSFKTYVFLNRLRNFTSSYGSIIAFFSSIIAITYYFYQFSGGNPAVVALPIITFGLLFSYIFLRKRKEVKT